MPKHSNSLKHSNPDRGPPMMEGAHHFDKGYMSDDESIDPSGQFPGESERGNSYIKLNHEIMSKDSAKLKRSKFSKIA